MKHGNSQQSKTGMDLFFLISAFADLQQTIGQYIAPLGNDSSVVTLDPSIRPELW